MLGTYHRLDVTVHDSWRTVVRRATTRLAPPVRRDPAYREQRKRFYRTMLTHHQQAQELVIYWRL